MSASSRCQIVLDIPIATVRCLRKPTEEKWWRLHDGHDVGSRHLEGRLFSATCHDCGTSWRRADADEVDSR